MSVCVRACVSVCVDMNVDVWICGCESNYVFLNEIVKKSVVTPLRKGAMIVLYTHTGRTGGINKVAFVYRS